MTTTAEYPVGYLRVLAGVLVMLILNAGILTARDLTGTSLTGRPLTVAAVSLAAVGVAVTATALVLGRWVVAFRGLSAALLASAGCAAFAPGDIVLAGDVPWTFHLGFVGLLAAAVCLRASWLAPYSIAVLTCEGLVGRWQPTVLPLLLTAAVAVVAGHVLLLRIVTILLATQRADQRAAAATLDQAASTADGSARELWDAWVHDHVLVAFRLGSQREPSAAFHARDLLAAELSRPDTEMSSLRTVAQKVANQHRIWLRWSVIQSSQPSNEVSYAIQQAVGEALRNAARHSGVRAVTVSGAVSAVSVDLSVADTGRGFDPHAQTAGLGIPTSIVGQLNAVGGRAEILSSPDRGTKVVMTWRLETLPEPTLDVPLQVAVAGAAAIAVLSAARTAIYIGPDHLGWIFAGLVAVLGLTLTMVALPRLTPPALAGWLVVTAVLAATAPMLGQPERTNWFTMGSAAIFLAAASNRRQGLGLALATMTMVTQLLVGVLLRPDELASGWGYWLQPVVYAGLAWLGLELLGRVLRRYRVAMSRATMLEQGLILRQAELAENQRRTGELPDDLFTVLEELASTPAVSVELGRRCALVEAATRDYLTAPRLVDRDLSGLLAHLRSKGAYISLSDGGPASDPAELTATRGAIRLAAPAVQEGSRLTVRWAVKDPRHFATVTVTEPRCLDSRATLDRNAIDILDDPHVLQLRLRRPASTSPPRDDSSAGRGTASVSTPVKGGD